ncbi:MAG: hypothetical protein GEU73_15825 [Chloroflexi bacterium]|nr:hypothetical protein [Chloroflexota bacterium]
MRRHPFSLHRYAERALETKVTCDNCGLEFVVYGVFASCPDFLRLNALTTCLASLDVARKLVRLSEDTDIDADLRPQFPRDALGESVSVFDAFGRALRLRQPGVIRANAKLNLFQDLDALDGELRLAGLPDLPGILGTDLDRLYCLFQARHLYEHQAGVVDNRFVAKLPAYAHLRGQLRPIPATNLTEGIDALERLARDIDRLFTGGPRGSP